ncbi:hypothetical protein GCM10017776_09410 [Streptomyces griseoluteus]|nr:hypothetical protein GCM10017776_09410 [Streptomyces griseoluteus]
MSCIQVPVLETRWATDHHRMLRYFRERQGEEASVSARGRGAPAEEEDMVAYLMGQARSR